jgi:hypothetical protein
VTPSEHLWALATERANAPEHMRELFALAIDRATWEVADEINQAVGRSASFNYGLHPCWSGLPYAERLHHYIQLKLRLHRENRRYAMCEDHVMATDGLWLRAPEYRHREDVAFLRNAIMAMREQKNRAIWDIDA